jgi:competence protein ComFC
VRDFLRSLNSILFEINSDFDIKTDSFISFRGGIPIYAGSRLTPELSSIASRAKENNDLAARKFLATLINNAFSLINSKEVSVILIPSRSSADRNRGIKHINELVKEVGKLREIEVFDILEHARIIKDQTKLTRIQRIENLMDAFIIRKTNVPEKAFLLDDLVTSGATALAAAKALKVRNIQLLGVITACASASFTE